MNPSSLLRLCWLLMGLALTGCQHRPLQVVLQGNMAMEGDVTSRMPTENTASRLVSVPVSGPQQNANRIALIDVDGLLINENLRGYGSMGENPVALFREKLSAVQRDPSVRAVVLRINSPGGSVTASDIMLQDLESLKSRRQLPVVACLMDVGTGGAYYLATGAGTIVAHPTTVTGGIGVILNTYNLEDVLGQFNVIPATIKAGQNIDLGSPIRLMSEEERRMLEQLAEHFHQRFRAQVQRARPQNLAVAEQLDGRVFAAHEALAARLIDEIGYLDDAINLAEQAAGLTSAPSVIMYRRCSDRAYTSLDVTPNIPLQNSILPFNVPGLDRSQLPTFLYLWQIEPRYVTARGG